MAIKREKIEILAGVKDVSKFHDKYEQNSAHKKSFALRIFLSTERRCEF